MSSPIIWGAGGTARMLNSGALEFNNGVTMDTVSGDPNGVVTALKGSVILDVTNAKEYINTDGATAWELVNHTAITVANAANAAVTLTLSGSNALSGAFVVSNSGLTHLDLVASNNNSDTNYLHLTQTQVSALHPAVTVSNAATNSVTLTLGSNQVLSGVVEVTNLTLSHSNLVASNNNSDTNYLHLTQTQVTNYNNTVIPRLATHAALKAAKSTVGGLVYCTETQGLYHYCSNCTIPIDDDLVTITGDGGNTRWEMIQKVSRTQGDTGWIARDSAVVTKLSATSVRLTLSSAGAYSIKSVRKDLPAGNYDCTITGIAGVKYVGFSDLTGVLTCKDSLWDFGLECPAILAYWSGTAIVGEPQTELHGIRDTVWHAYAHKHFGLQYDSGLVFTGAIQSDNNNNPADDTCTFLWATDGAVTDEDITATPGIGQWLQTLGTGLTTSNAGIFNHFYYNGSFVTTVAAMADRAPFIHAGAGTLPQWNSGGTLTASVDGDYVVYHYFSTPMVGGWSVFARPHNAKYASLAAAQAATPGQLVWTSFAEVKHLYTAVWKVRTTFTNASHRAKLVSLQSYRLTPGTPASGVSATDHQSLSNRDAPNVHPDTSIFGTTANSLLRVSVAGPIEEVLLGVHIAALTEKTVPVAGDMLALADSATSNTTKKLDYATIVKMATFRSLTLG